MQNHLIVVNVKKDITIMDLNKKNKLVQRLLLLLVGVLLEVKYNGI